MLGKYTNNVKSLESGKVIKNRNSVLISDLDQPGDHEMKAQNERAHQRIAKKREAKLLASEDALKMIDLQGNKLDGRTIRAQKELPAYQ